MGTPRASNPRGGQVRVSWSRCEMLSVGADMRCPACGTTVPDNHRHACECTDGVVTQTTTPIRKAAR